MNDYFETPAVVRLISALQARFPGIKFGVYNRRKILGTLSWSQHSWPNAIDIYFTVPAGDTSPEHQSMLADVNHYLKYLYPNRDEIRNRLWLVRNHFDHIHVDCWPKGYGEPSRVRGGLSNRYQRKDGTIITQEQLEQEGEDQMAILTDAEQLELSEFLRHIKEQGSNVSYVKHAIQSIRDHRPGGPLAPQAPVDLDDYEIIIQRKEV